MAPTANLKKYEITLVTAPQSDPTQMHVAVPNLIAFMRANGYPHTAGRDCSIGAYEYFLRRDRLEQGSECLRHRLRELDEKHRLTQEEAKRFYKLAKCLLLSDAVIDGIDDALAIVRTPRGFHDFDAYWDAINLIEHALQIVSAEFDPWDWSMFGCEAPGDRNGLTSLISAVQDFENNPFVEYYRAEVLPWLAKEPCDLLGISMVYTSQLIPGLALAALAKKQNPKLRVVAGGNSISRVTQALTGTTSWLPFTDYVVYSEGELALLRLVQALESGSQTFDEVPNVRFFSATEGKVIESPLHIEDLDSHPTPDFSHLSLDSYLSPTPVITLDVTRGCYWGKCAFCSYGVSDKILKAYRERSPDRIIDDLRTLGKAYGVSHYLFSVDVLSPAFVRKLSRRLLDEKLSIRWMGDMRLESVIDDQLSQLMSSSGCRFISSGLETASQRVQDWMDKGTDQSHASRILKGYRRAGIGVNIQFFLGFPTETSEEAHVTLDFVKSHHDAINTVGFGHFQLLAGAAVEKNPERFGVIEIRRGPTSNLSMRFPYESVSGLTNKEAEKLITSEKEKLDKIYPLCSNMSLLIGAHGLLHLSNLGPDEFDMRLRAKACRRLSGIGLVPALPLDPESRIGLTSGTTLIELRHDLFEIANGLKSANDRGEETPLASSALEPNPLGSISVLYQANTGKFCRLSPDQRHLVSTINKQVPLSTLFEQMPFRTTTHIASLVRALQRAGFVSVVSCSVSTQPTPHIAKSG